MGTATYLSASARSYVTRKMHGHAAALGVAVAVAAIFAGPVLMNIARNAAATGAVAPFIFILLGSSWLLQQTLAGVPRERGLIIVTAILLAPLLAIYGLARVTGLDWPAWIAICGVVAVMVRDRYGWRGVARGAAPLLLLTCLVPPPIELALPISDSVIDWTASLAVALARSIGIDAAIATPMLYVDQYELLLADACAGFGTLFSAGVCMLLYAHLRHRGDWRRVLLIGVLALPVALAANLVRVLLILLVIITLGDQWARGTLHDAAGLLMFGAVLGTLIGLDSLIGAAKR